MCKRIYYFKKCTTCGEKRLVGKNEFVACNAKREIWEREVSKNETAMMCSVRREDRDMEPGICKTCEESSGD